jgi:hypothetical protein
MASGNSLLYPDIYPIVMNLGGIYTLTVSIATAQAVRALNGRPFALSCAACDSFRRGDTQTNF